jgi:hypothetical protein
MSKTTLDAYDSFLGLLDDESKRTHLENLRQFEADPLFEEARTLSHSFRDGLQELGCPLSMQSLVFLSRRAGLPDRIQGFRCIGHSTFARSSRYAAGSRCQSPRCVRVRAGLAAVQGPWHHGLVMRRAATLDVVVPQTRRLELQLPEQIPPGRARFVVFVGDDSVQQETTNDTVECDAGVDDEDGLPVLRVPEGAVVDWNEVTLRRVLDQRTVKLSGLS